MEKVGYRMINGGLTRCPPDWVWRRAEGAGPHTTLWSVADGVGRLVVGDEVFDLSRGDTFEIPPGPAVMGSHDPKRPLLVYWIHYLSQQGVSAEGVLYQRMDEMGFYQEVLDRVLAQGLGDNIWVAAALAERRRLRNLTGAEVKGYEREQAAKVEALCGRIAASPELDWSVERLAAGLSCTRQHARRLFLKYKGKTPARFIVERRVEMAKSFLVSSSMTMKQIADALGYSDVYFFCRQFRLVAGLPPGRFRKSAPAPGGR